MTTYYDRSIYFDEVRKSLFGGTLTQEQVDGQNVILGTWEYQQLLEGGMDDQRWLAYMLATAYHETAYHMWPIEEYGKGSGKSYGATDAETGQAYYGRGLVQLTWRENYSRASDILNLQGERDIEWHADRALDILIATRVMFKGMREGWFTSKYLGQYFSDTKNDPKNARQIINGNDKDTTIAGYHETFLAALGEALQERERRPVDRDMPQITVTIASDRPVKLLTKLGRGVMVN